MNRVLPLDGRARRVGDDINTDAIVPSRRKHESSDPQRLRHHLFEDVDAAFAASVRDGDILVAGRNFGCGSAMEVAVTTVLGAGFRAVVAKSFARGYLRNAMNNGLLAICGDTDGIVEGESIALSAGQDGSIEMRTATRRITCESLPPFMQAMIQAGGLVPYLRAHGSFGPELPGESD